MTHNKLILLVTIVLATAAGGIAFQVSQKLESRGSGPCRAWMSERLDLNEEQYSRILQVDPDYEQDAAAFSAGYRAERQQLGQLLMDAESSDSRITEQVEAVLEANSRLVTRIVDHILIVRDSLTPEQQQQFTELCNRIIRGRQGRMMQQAGSDGGTEVLSGGGRMRKRQGGGDPELRGSGNGRGMQNRYRNRGGLRNLIEFTPEQKQLFEQLDPGFDGESAELAAAVRQQQEQLAGLLASLSVEDEEVLAQLDVTLETRSQLEHRTVQYLLRIRSYLTAEQQKQLVGLCGRCGSNVSSEEPVETSGI